MTAYENALAVKARNTGLIKDLENQISEDRGRDKTGLRWQFRSMGNRSMSFETECYHGYYGNSSVSSDNSEELGREIAETLSNLKHEIIRVTIARLKSQIQAAAVAAKSEAQDVLAEFAK